MTKSLELEKGPKMGLFEWTRLDTCPHYKEESFAIFYCELREGTFPENRCDGNPYMGYYKPRLDIKGCKRYLESEGLK